MECEISGCAAATTKCISKIFVGFKFSMFMTGNIFLQPQIHISSHTFVQSRYQIHYTCNVFYTIYEL